MLGGIYKFGSNQGSIPINYLGTWNASTNVPALASGVGTNGDMYVVNVAGTTTLDGISDWDVGDWVVFNGPLGVWQKIDNSDFWVKDTNGCYTSEDHVGVGTNSDANYSMRVLTSGTNGLHLGSDAVTQYSLFQGKVSSSLVVQSELASNGSSQINIAGGLTNTLLIGQGNAPISTSDQLYNLSGVLYWAGYPISAGASQWTADANGLTTSAFKLGVGVASSADYCLNSTVASGNTGIYLKSSNGQCTSTLQGFGATSLSVTGENSSSGISVTGLKGASLSLLSNTAGFDASLSITADTAGSAYLQIGQGNPPGTTTNRLYNLSGVLTWNGVDISTAPISPTGIIFESAAGEKFNYPSANPAPLDTDTGTNGTIKCHLFDSSTDEFVEGQFQLPASLTGYTTINLEAYVYHKTAKTDKTVQMVFSHSAKNTTESWDDTYTDETSAAETVRDAADELYMLDWTETIANAGWAAGDQVRFKLWRDVSGDDLDEDACLTHFRVRLS